MRTEETFNLTSAGASLTGVISGGYVHSYSAPTQAVPGHPDVESFPRRDQADPVAPDQWKVDEHWTAVTAYLAQLYLPNEG